MTFVNRDRKICETFICAFLADANSKKENSAQIQKLKTMQNRQSDEEMAKMLKFVLTRKRLAWYCFVEKEITFHVKEGKDSSA